MSTKKKNHSYLVYLIVHDIVSVDIIAKDEESAKEKAKQKIDGVYKETKVDCVDGSTTFAGILLSDEWGKIN